MKYLAILCLVVTIGCTNKGDEEINSADTSTIGVDSTKIGSDSGILKKLP